jgi:hypothetical protein
MLEIQRSLFVLELSSIRFGSRDSLANPIHGFFKPSTLTTEVRISIFEDRAHLLLYAFLPAGMILWYNALRIALVAPLAFGVSSGAVTPNLTSPAAQTCSLLCAPRTARSSFCRLWALLHHI